MEYTGNYSVKGMEIDINYNKNEFGETFLISAKGNYKHDLEITKNDNYSVCWSCEKNNQSLININTGIEVKNILDFENKVISDYMSDESFNAKILKELRIIELEIKNKEIELNMIRSDLTMIANEIKFDKDVKEFIEKQSESLGLSEEKVINLCINKNRKIMSDIKNEMQNKNSSEKSVLDVIKQSESKFNKLSELELDDYISKQAKAFNIPPVRFINDSIKNYMEISKDLNKDLLTEKSNMKKTEELIFKLEENKTLFGSEERNFMVNYAYQNPKENFEKIEKLVDYMALQGYEKEHGFLDPYAREFPKDYIEKALVNVDKEMDTNKSKEKNNKTKDDDFMKEYLEQQRRKSLAKDRQKNLGMER